VRVLFVRQEGLAGRTSTAIWQRLNSISTACDASIVTAGSIPANLTKLKVLQVNREPQQQDSGPLRQFYRRAAFAVKVCTNVRRLTRNGRRPDWIYTFHNYDLVIGMMLRVAGYRWAVDVLDPPDLLLEDVPAAYRQRRLLKVALLRLFVLLARKAIRQADLVIVSAPDQDSGFAALLKDEYRVSAERLVALPNGVDPELILQKPIAEPHCGKPLRTLYVGTVGKQRGTFFLLDVINEVRHRAPVSLTIVGPAEGEAGTALASRISELHLGETVHWVGQLSHSEVIEQVDLCDVGLYPFPNAGVLDGVIPIKVGEYMARGKPVVASDLTGVRALVTDGTTGFLVPPLALDAWTAVLLLLSQDADLRARMGAAGLLKAADFAWPSINAAVVAALTSAAT